MLNFKRYACALPVKWLCIILIFSGSAYALARVPAVINSLPINLQPIIKKGGKPAVRLSKKHSPQPVYSFTNPTPINVTLCGSSYTITPASPLPAGYTSLMWSDGSTGPTLTVTQSGTYWWQETGGNVVTNGDFSAGNTGFTSQYAFKDLSSGAPGCKCVLVPESDYGVGTNPNDYHSAFSAPNGDHTTGTGNMLIVNGAPTANVQVWAENIPVIPNTDYVFSYWATSVSPSNPATLQFTINGTQLSTITLSATASVGTWQYFSTTWNSGSLNGSYQIALVNQNTVASGNDFAVDDIVFAPVYRQSYNVTLNPIPVLTIITPSPVCGTFDLTQTIGGYDPATYTYTFTDAAGNVIPAGNISAITQSGTYTITAQNKTTGCTSTPQSVTITVNPNPVKPAIAAQ
jgi:hypothetical protein